MEVILQQDIRGLGYTNDLIKVKPGYGRNFLIPRGYAIVANSSNKKRIAENVRQASHKVALVKKEAEETAGKIEGIVLDLEAKVGTSGKIFGSITTTQIAAKLKAKGFEIDRKKIIMEESPKEIGTYPITLDLHKEIKPTIQVNITAESEKKEQ